MQTACDLLFLTTLYPTGAILNESTKFATNLTTDVITQMIDQIFAYRTFGVRYSLVDREWRIIPNNNLSVTNAFNMGKSETTQQNLDPKLVTVI